MAKKTTKDNFRITRPTQSRKKTMRVLSQNFVGNIPGFFERFGVRMDGSPTRMLLTIGDRIREASDPLGYANGLIAQLGGLPVTSTNFTVVDMTAKHIILHAFNNPLGYDPQLAQAGATAYVNLKQKDHPWMFTTGETKVNSTTSETNDKKTRALQIYTECKDMPVKHVCERIMKELDITYANAYYYVRGFNKQFA